MGINTIVHVPGLNWRPPEKPHVRPVQRMESQLDAIRRPESHFHELTEEQQHVLLRASGLIVDIAFEITGDVEKSLASGIEVFDLADRLFEEKNGQ